MTAEKFSHTIVAALDELKAVNIQLLDVRRLTSMTDFMIIASGRSTRQVKALADKVIETAKKSDNRPLGVEGQKQGEWILVDLGDVIAHIMHPETRLYYQLEKLWSTETHQASFSK